MGSTAIIAAIDKELARLHQTRTRILARQKVTAKGKKAGRSGLASKPAKRQLSAEGRARIAEAQRKRWAAARKAKNK
jgi:hypothetical protein